MATKRLRKSASWITETQRTYENLEETKAFSRIVLRIVRYMKDNGLTQKELAARDSDLRITTALRYGRLLGLDLISVPDLQEPSETETQKIIVQFQISTSSIMLNDVNSGFKMYYPQISNLNKKWHKKDSNLRA